MTFHSTWSKRGHTANYGFGFVISEETGKVLDYGFRSKFVLHVKKQMQTKRAMDIRNGIPSTSHIVDPRKNYEGSSSGIMEVSIADELWKRLLEFEMR